MLLLAALHDGPALQRLCRRAGSWGLAALVEVHDQAEVDRARRLFEPTGVNSRDLRSFRVALLAPLALRPAIDWDTTLVYESGVKGLEGILLARSGGFDAVLVGEAAVRSPEGVAALAAALESPLAARGFWARLAARRGGRADEYVGVKPGGAGLRAGVRRGETRRSGLRPLVKICGLARATDARLAASLGADLLGFVFAPSPRRAEPALLRELAGLNVLKIGVVTEPEGTAQARALLEQGLLDALQLHGEEPPAECLATAFPAMSRRCVCASRRTWRGQGSTPVPAYWPTPGPPRPGAAPGAGCPRSWSACWRSGTPLAGRRPGAGQHPRGGAPLAPGAGRRLQPAGGLPRRRTGRRWSASSRRSRREVRNDGQGVRVLRGVRGRYVAEVLRGALDDLEEAFLQACADPSFAARSGTGCRAPSSAGQRRCYRRRTFPAPWAGRPSG